MLGNLVILPKVFSISFYKMTLSFVEILIFETLNDLSRNSA
jgi:hypothetical protein